MRAMAAAVQAFKTSMLTAGRPIAEQQAARAALSSALRDRSR
jgi:hypothetical protein